MDHRELTGKTEDHLELVPELDVYVHQDICKPLLALKKEAKKEGFDLCVASGYRSYERQERIWNNKTSGKAPVLDSRGEKVDGGTLSPQELVYAVCRWSAIPGASRHHWGTDVDVYDQNALPSSDYKVQLSPQEVEEQGIFAPFHEWLDSRIKNNKTHGFMRPYQRDTGGIYPERWHLSFLKVAGKYQEDYTFDFFCQMLDEASFHLQNIVHIHRQDIYSRFICRNKAD